MPKKAKARNITTPSFRELTSSSGSGTGSESSSVIMMLTKNSLYFDIRLITSTASSWPIPRCSKSSTISSISPSGWLSSSHASRSFSRSTYELYERDDRYSPTPMLIASASTFETPIASTATGVRCAPTAPATMANEVRMPSRPPKTIVFTIPPAWLCSSSAPAPARAACAIRLASTSKLPYADRAAPRSRDGPPRPRRAQAAR